MGRLTLNANHTRRDDSSGVLSCFTESGMKSLTFENSWRPLSLETPMAISLETTLRFSCETPTFSMETPYFCWRPPDSPWRSLDSLWRPPDFRWRPHIFVGNLHISIGDPLLSLETPDYHWRPSYFLSPTQIWGLQWKSGGLQWKSGGLQRESGGFQRWQMTNALPNLQLHPGHLNLINNVEDIVVSLGLNLFNSDHFYFPAVEMGICHFRKLRWKIHSFQNYKHWYLIHTWPDKAVMCTETLSYLHGWSLEITLIVPLIRVCSPLFRWTNACFQPALSGIGSYILYFSSQYS